MKHRFENVNKDNVVDAIIAFETGDIRSEKQIISLFKYLKSSGMLYNLQGFYGRMYADLQSQGLL